MAGTAFSQTASVIGRITDGSGAVIPGARVTATSAASGVATSVDTNDQGFYNIPALPPAVYTISVERSGFQTLRQTNLELQVQQVARLDLVLRVGAVSESVEVRAQSVVLESETATMGQVIQSKQVTELPLLGRNTYALAMLVPGVRPSAGVNNLVVDQISTVSYSINGQRASANEFLLDGAPNSSPSQNQPVVNPNPDMVQEFKVETNGYSAEYGRAAGGVFNVVTRSGTNKLQFSLYEFFRNDKLNANDFFANVSGKARPPFKFNQFGGTVGAPVYIPKLSDGRNKTFFFVSSETVRFVQGITFTGSVPLQAQLAGDFAGARNSAGGAVSIYDPLTTASNPAGGSIRQVFAASRIPASRINPVAQRLASFFPPANTAGNAVTGINNYARTDGNRVDKDTGSFRIDHYINERNRLFGRYSYDDSPFVRAAPYGRDNLGSPGTGPQVFRRFNAVVEDTHTLSPTLLATARYSFTRLGNVRTPFSAGFDLGTLGFPAGLGPQIEPRAFPNIGITGFGVTGSIPNIVVGGVLGATDLIRLGNNVHSVQGSASKTLTRHTLKMGGEFRVVQFNNQQTGANTPVFNFTPAFTQGPNPGASSATAGLGLASFLLGYPASGSVNPAPALANQTKYHALFIQDNWKATSKLTINMGLRWEYESPRTDRFNQLTNFDFAAKPPLNAPGLDLRGTLAFVGVGGLPRANARPDRNNFAPRFGVAYSVAPKTVLRAGGGLFFAGLTGIGTGSGTFGISGFQAGTNMVTSLDGFTPLDTLSNPYPNGLNRASGSSLGGATLLGQAVSFFDRGNVTPYAGQWNFNIQRELPGAMLFEVGYMGSRGLKFSQDRQFNQMPDSALELRDGLRTLVPNPFFGQISTGTLAQRTVARAQLLRPYPHFDAVTSNIANNASSIYHAMTAKAEKRFASGFLVLVSYTFSKGIDYGIGTFAGEEVGGAGFQNWNAVRFERSVSTLDQTHRWIANSVYDLPFFKGRKGVSGRILGGWEVGGIASFLSGGPLGMGSAVNNTFSQGGGQRPNWSGASARLSNPTPARWFDTAQFTAPPAYTFGNGARTFGGLRSDGTSQIDLSLNKSTAISERFKLQFRTEVFNVSNSPRFAPPNQSQGNPSFAVVSAMGNQARVVQFGLKLIY